MPRVEKEPLASESQGVRVPDSKDGLERMFVHIAVLVSGLVAVLGDGDGDAVVRARRGRQWRSMWRRCGDFFCAIFLFAVVLVLFVVALIDFPVLIFFWGYVL